MYHNPKAMKHSYLKHILLFICLFTGINTFAYDVQIDGIYYNFSGDEAEVTYYSLNSNSIAYSGVIVIPPTVTYNSKTYNVTRISNYAFYACSGLTSVQIPNSVTSIGGDAFKYCSSLTVISIPNSVTSIGSNAFDYSGWYNNQSDGFLYLDYWLLGYKGEKLTGAITMADNTKFIAAYVFKNCTDLTYVTIPNSLTSISTGAFSGCRGLTSVTIPNSVTSISSNAFYGCI